MNSYTDDFERWYYEWLAQRQAGGRPSSINAARAAWAAARAWDKLSTPCGPGMPVAWVASHENGRVRHFAKADGWSVEAVLFEPSIPCHRNTIQGETVSDAYIDHARRELNAIGYKLDGPLEEGPNKWIMENLFELLEAFGKQGHSGSSAPMVAGMFKKLALFEPLGPLTGADDEWVEVGDGHWQNKRCSHVFKEADGRAYDSEGIIFREPDGSCYTSRGSRVYITFPYVPERQYVNRPGS